MSERSLPANLRQAHGEGVAIPPSIEMNFLWGANDRPLVSKLTNIGMPADSCDRIPTPEGECLDPQSGRAVTVVGSRAEENFLLGRPGPGVPAQGISNPGSFGSPSSDFGAS
jgi:hypothetical protein